MESACDTGTVNKTEKHEEGHNWADPVYYPQLHQYQQGHRLVPTEAEAYLWEYLSGDKLGVRFRREYIIGEHIADFVCLKHKLIVEVDGGYHNEVGQMEDDEIRTSDLNRLGFHVIRFTNEEVLNNIDSVLDSILDNLNN